MDEHLIDKWWNRLPLNDAEFNKFSVDQMHHQSEFTQCAGNPEFGQCAWVTCNWVNRNFSETWIHDEVLDACNSATNHAQKWPEYSTEMAATLLSSKRI